LSFRITLYGFPPFSSFFFVLSSFLIVYSSFFFVLSSFFLFIPPFPPFPPFLGSSLAVQPNLLASPLSSSSFSQMLSSCLIYLAGMVVYYYEQHMFQQQLHFTA
jgi:hypothetical protein